jgi:hypothetical protein
MWLLATLGLYGVVAHRRERDRVLVRARARADLEALRRQIPGSRIRFESNADCRWRAVVTHAEWVTTLARLRGDIVYDNFTGAVRARRGTERARLYARVWSALRSRRS